MNCRRAFSGGALAFIFFVLSLGPGGARYAILDERAVAELFVGPDAFVGREIWDRDIVFETHLYCMGLAVYFEGGSTGESEEGQRHIARVIHERAKAGLKKWGGTDICDVVFYKRAGVCQFSFACLPVAARTPRGGRAWKYALAIAKDELDDRSNISERSIRYYMNPALTSDRNACRFRKEFVPVSDAGRHQFFREPTEAERNELAAGEPLECQRYALMLKKQEEERIAKAQRQKRLAALARNGNKKAGKKAKKEKIREARR